MKTKPVVLMILDGYGLSTPKYGNAISIANSGVINRLMNSYPTTTLGASGMCVGLPDGQMGNSEVGHLNMGAGRIVYQDLTRITKEISDGVFFQNKELVSAIENAKNNGKKLHFYGLLSNGGVHSHITHLYALLELCKKQNFDNVFVHCFLDGRDVAPTSGADFIDSLQKEIDRIGVGQIASVSGRYYAMDRDNRWDRVEKAYDALTIGNGAHCSNPELAVRESYNNGVTDEFVLPTNVVVDGKAINEEGNISGSTITLYQAVRNLMKFAGVSYAEALAYATIVPATEVGIDSVTGSIAEGKRADLLLVDAETYDIKSVWQAGEAVL